MQRVWAAFEDFGRMILFAVEAVAWTFRPPFRPDLVLCDIGLPGMDGYAVARAFRADPGLAHVRLVALSGYARPEDLERSAEAGFERHVAKPASLDALEDLIGAL